MTANNNNFFIFNLLRDDVNDIRLIPSEREYTTETGRKEEQMQRKHNAGHCHFDHAGSEAGREFTLGFLYPRTGSRGKVSLKKSFPRRGWGGQPWGGQPLHSEKVTLAVSRSRILSASPSHSKNVSLNNFLPRIVSAV